jgi:hypothetical protein
MTAMMPAVVVPVCALPFLVISRYLAVFAGSPLGRENVWQPTASLPLAHGLHHFLN